MYSILEGLWYTEFYTKGLNRDKQNDHVGGDYTMKKIFPPKIFFLHTFLLYLQDISPLPFTDFIYASGLPILQATP